MNQIEPIYWILLLICLALVAIGQFLLNISKNIKLKEELEYNKEWQKRYDALNLKYIDSYNALYDCEQKLIYNLNKVEQLQKVPSFEMNFDYLIPKVHSFSKIEYVVAMIKEQLFTDLFYDSKMIVSISVLDKEENQFKINFKLVLGNFDDSSNQSIILKDSRAVSKLIKEEIQKFEENLSE
jgi:hypothetical protein